MDLTSMFLDKFGPFQIILQLLSVPTQLFGCSQDLIYSFTYANPQLRCKYDGEFQNASYDQVFGLSNWSRLFQSESQGGFDVFCKFCPQMVSNGTIEPGVCGTNYTAQNCPDYVYDYSQYKSSIAVMYDLVCEGGAWKQELAETLMMVGSFIGAGFWGWLADTVGRKRAYIVSTLGLIVVTNVQPFLPTFELLAFFQVLIGFFNSGPITCIFTILMEYSSPKARGAMGSIFQMYYSVGIVILGMLAYILRDWKQLMWAGSMTNTLYVLTYFIMPESYSWLAAVGRTEEAKAEVQKAKESDVGNHSILAMFRHRRTAIHTAIIFYLAFAVSISYFGVTLNINDLPGSMYQNFVIMGAVEVIGYMMAIPLMNTIGRVPCLYGFMVIGGVALVLSGILPRPTFVWLILTLAIVGKICIAAAFGVLFNYNAEYFPTAMRSAAGGIGGVFSALGSIGAPQIQLLTIYTESWVPFVAYGATAVSAGIVAFFLPETKDKQLPQTIEQTIQNSDKHFLKRQKADLALRKWNGAEYEKW